MKHWVITFTAILAAGIVLVFIFARWQAARDEHARRLAKWTADANEVIVGIRTTIQQEPGNEFVLLGLYRSQGAGLLIDIPDGADAKSLKDAMEDAENERNICFPARH